MIDFKKVQRFTVTPLEFGHYYVEMVEQHQTGTARVPSMVVCVCTDKDTALQVRQALEQARVTERIRRVMKVSDTPPVGAKG